MDTVLVDWLLEQLIDDVYANEGSIQANTWTGPLWLWCVMFGAAIASSGRAANAVEERQLNRWIKLYDERIRMVSRALGLRGWDSARPMLARFVRNMDQDMDIGLKEIWNRAVADGSHANPPPAQPTAVDIAIAIEE